MKLLWALPLLWAQVWAQDGSRLIPNGMLQFEFPELPETLKSMSTGEKRPAMMTVTFPADYTLQRKFPLFVYLIGGNGGSGDKVDLGRTVIGPNGYICVAMPLFKRKVDVEEPSRGLMVSMDDYAVIASSYKVMLERLFRAVPNITAEGSTFGGHSNGAHTTGVLLAAQDDYLLEHFRAFYLHEGGLGMLLANVLQKRSLRKARFLVMMGDKTPGGAAQEAPMIRLMRFIESFTTRAKLDFTYVVMRGYGHEQPPEYLAQIGQWARGEPLASVPPR